ncbi:D-arabinitol dehydrogenase 1 [Pseudolycoriella hygida]|uniref:D-arabinitol dehydrogenase 1 n=1 Tax=Pseudolycoriella hygida TaxID=35572 RepID=A0A9Q0MQF3_9DIPT|nr:D-arabinitol dehydrogenase 1 [Pseudolycoriella hygida]
MEYLSFDLGTKELTLNTCDIPKPDANDVLIRVAYSGICGTDVHILNGSFPAKNDGPLILGHEFVGIIESMGNNVTSFKIGQKVAVNPHNGCDNCDFCHRGKYHFCEKGGLNNSLGIFRNGGWTTHAIVPENQVHLIPEEVELHQAVLTEPLSCIAHGWNLINPVHVGSKVLVLGGGIIGLLWTCLMHLHRLRKTVTVSEPQEKRRLAVSKLDLDYNVKHPTEVTENFDLVVDCSGSGPAMESAAKLLKHGGCLCIFGVANPNATMTLRPFEIFMKELKVIGVNINLFTFPKALQLVQAMADRYLHYDSLGIRVYKLAEFRQALLDLRNGEIIDSSE